MQHRTDIDGLRAVAVLPVILFHAGIPGFSGGFVGVDIFFVISGYLITSIMAREVSAGKFSILSFYARRIRRIFPAFFVMIAACAIAGSLLLLPSELKNLGSSIVAATLFTSNMLFWRQSGYFSDASQSNPLLHTWSLGIEEQFYLGFPLFLWLWTRYVGRKYWSGVLIFAVFSLALSAYCVGRWERATFYLIITRAWELLFGALLAIRLITMEGKPALRDALSIAGLLLIAWPILTFSNTTSFPGANALFPCAGAGLIILTGMSGNSLAGRALSNPIFVFIGLISYSLYLWHWPIIVFSNFYAILPLSGLEKTAVIVLSFVVATLSWRFVETPFRRSHFNWSERRIFATAVGAMVISSAIGVMFYLDNGLPWRLSPQTQALAAGATDVGMYTSTCLDGVAVAEGRCRLGVSGVAPSFLLWGDSHAASAADGLDLVAKSRNRSGLYVGMYSCPPLIGIDGWYQETAWPRERCKIINSDVPSLLKQSGIKIVILDASWGRLATEYGRQEVANDAILTGAEYRREDFYYIDRTFRATLDVLKNIGCKVFIVTETPDALSDVPAALARSAFLGRHVDIRDSYLHFIQSNEFSFELFAHVARRYGADLIRPDLALCDHSKCAVEKEGRALYSDSAHLSRFGAQSIAPIFERIFVN